MSEFWANTIVAYYAATGYTNILLFSNDNSVLYLNIDPCTIFIVNLKYDNTSRTLLKYDFEWLDYSRACYVFTSNTLS